MSQSSDDLIWDGSGASLQVCDLATARAAGDQVVLTFGARAADDLQVQAFGVRVLRRIALRPASARHLRDMLAQATEPRGGAGGAHGR